jgi:predicted secreted protein
MEGIFSREIKRWGQLNTEFDMEEVDFNVSNKEISEPINLEVQDIIFKFKLQKASGIDGIIAEILQKMSPTVWRTHSLIKII